MMTEHSFIFKRTIHLMDMKIVENRLVIQFFFYKIVHNFF